MRMHSRPLAARLDRDVNGLLEKRRWLLEHGALARTGRR